MDRHDNCQLNMCKTDQLKPKYSENKVLLGFELFLADLYAS
jgi:hypothetical protein